MYNPVSAPQCETVADDGEDSKEILFYVEAEVKSIADSD